MLFPGRFAAFLLCALSALLCAAPLRALPTGIAVDCTGCHGVGADIELEFDPPEFEPGARVRLTAVVSGGPAETGGIYISINRGEIFLVPGEGLKLVDPLRALQSAPKQAENGRITFSVDWQSPADPAAVEFDVFGISSNNNLRRSGDNGGYTTLTKVIGCLGATFYADADGDGYGSSLYGTVVDCAPPEGYAIEDGDCKDYDAEVYPGRREMCNDQDDDCDGDIDERASPTCGLGLCRRRAFFCDENAPCEPGLPAEEICNGLDDDCDGMIDRGDICPDGQVCQIAVCKTLEEAMAEDPAFVPYVGYPEIGFTGGASDPLPPFNPGTSPVMPDEPTGSMDGAPSDPTSPPLGPAPGDSADPTAAAPQSPIDDAGTVSGCRLDSHRTSLGATPLLALLGALLIFRRRRSGLL